MCVVRRGRHGQKESAHDAHSFARGSVHAPSGDGARLSAKHRSLRGVGHGDVPTLRYRLRPPLFFQHHVTAAVLELDVGHERPHQQHAAPARTIQMGRIGGIGETVGIEAGAFVGDLHPDFLGRKPTTEADVLATGPGRCREEWRSPGPRRPPGGRRRCRAASSARLPTDGAARPEAPARRRCRWEASRRTARSSCRRTWA